MMQIERVLVADPLDSVVIDLLTAAAVVVDVNTGLSEAQLIQIIPVSVSSSGQAKLIEFSPPFPLYSFEYIYSPLLSDCLFLSLPFWIQEYDAVIVRSSTQITANIIRAGKKLKVIGRAGVGVDNIDVSSATSQNVLVIK